MAAAIGDRARRDRRARAGGRRWRSPSRSRWRTVLARSLRPLPSAARPTCGAASRSDVAHLPRREAHHRRGRRGDRRAAAAGRRLRGHAQPAAGRAYQWDQPHGGAALPRDFDRDYSFEPRRARWARPTRGAPIILSVPALHESFEDPEDGYHVGLHEFAHLLDRGHALRRHPARPRRGAQPAWVALAAREMERMRRGNSVIDPYGAESPVEFLAVAVEAFFESPLRCAATRRGLRDPPGLLRPGPGRLGRGARDRRPAGLGDRGQKTRRLRRSTANLAVSATAITAITPACTGR